MSEPGASETWIRLAGIRFFHGRLAALDGVDLTFGPGRHYIVAGPNGAGKSTLLDIIACLRRPAAGRYTLLEKAAESYTVRERGRLVALAPQEFHPEFPFTVREIVSMGRRPHLDRWGRLREADRRAVDEAMAAAHILHLADTAVTALSGGERKRCVIARCLAQDTPVILLDEPGAGLDVLQALTVMSLAREKARRGALVITVSHDLNLAARYGHEFIFLRSGKVAAAGPVKRVFTAAVLSQLYDTPCRVADDPYACGPAAVFRLNDTAKTARQTNAGMQETAERQGRC